VVLWICPFKMDISTCVWVYHSTYKWTYPQYHMCVILSFYLQMDISTIPRVCDFIISLTDGLIHICVIHSTYKWTYPQYHRCVILSFHLQMDLSTIPRVWVELWICPFVGRMIKSHTCVIVDMSICRWNDKIIHVVLWICPFVGGIIKSHTCGIVNMSICRCNESHKCG
jgi:hypothetical protein